MKRTQTILAVCFMLLCLITLLIYAVGTIWPMLIPLWLISEGTLMALSSISILMTLAIIPFALRFFKFKTIEHSLYRHPAQALLRWGLLRLLMLGTLLLFNLLLYFLLGHEPTFGWLAVIIILVLPFVVPTKDRCLSETTPEKVDNHPESADNHSES
jgi:hypothetical protein